MKNHLWEDLTRLWERGYVATKINMTFFVGSEVLNIFHLPIFWKKTKQKNNFFQNNCETQLLVGMTIVEGKRCRTTRMNMTFSGGNWMFSYSRHR